MMGICKYCGEETAYGDKHGACEMGSPYDQAMMRRAMQGYPENVYSINGKTVTKEEWDEHFKHK